MDESVFTYFKGLWATYIKYNNSINIIKNAPICILLPHGTIPCLQAAFYHLKAPLQALQ